MFGNPSRRELLRLLERERVQHRVEVSNLLDRMAALADRPWTLPPRDVFPEVEPTPADELQFLPL